MEQRSKPRISVVIPFKNAEKFLRESIESVMNQECDFPFEIIAIDDNSNDNSLTIANIFSDSGVLVFKSDGHGISDALNTGVRLSKGQLIARHDADDIMVQGRLQSQFDFMSLNEDHVVLGGQISFIGENLDKQSPNYYPTSWVELESWLARGCFLAHPTVVFRKSDFLAVGGYKKKNDGAEDYDLWLRLSRVGRIANLGRVVTRYRRHENQVTREKWVRTHLRTAKVRAFWIINFSELWSRSHKHSKVMRISRFRMLKYLLLEIIQFVSTQMRLITKK
jgi:glycosyltransferase involved in cell wall biosynthesis